MMSHPPKAFYNESFLSLKTALKIGLPIFSLVFLLGCHLNNDRYQRSEPFPRRVENIVVVGFKVALSEKEAPGLFRCPLCGALFMAEPVPDKAAEEMSVDLFDHLSKVKAYSLISPEQAKGVCSTILSQNLTIGVIDMLKETGRSFGSDAVLFGYIYRWRERIGTQYGVTSPASVAFDLHLLSPESGSILWKGSFNKTQLSLAENVLDLSTFIRSRGKWLTARELAQIGLEKLMKNSPRTLNSTHFFLDRAQKKCSYFERFLISLESVKTSLISVYSPHLRV
jgi:hypothetical protein